ncbi:hypothetical protein SAMN05443574_1371 [Haloarcula vallismortis]|uniref:DUF1641 domain-containing protein n=2 Tax=Haloarcula vallismortis TaxID=28442 RepID=M0JPJ4_HALVA|nr:hypothetical protein [Haloarcula vallismortis]EMA11027.1 hypothetical protein C437_02127 [Haloarcula vallismortis ATCC 29715]SDX36465.1 hypothetical protein SAMN05443574_1371 [Haloarcula vallismortis]
MSDQQPSADDVTEELTTTIEENPEGFATFVRNLETINELVEVAELGTAAMDDEMVTSLAGTGASLGELADTAASDDTRRALETVLSALGEADSSGPVDLHDVWDGIRSGEFLTGIRYVLTVVRSLGRAVQNQ